MRRYFFTGLIILLPLTLTFWLFWYLLELFTSPFLPILLKKISLYYPYIPHDLVSLISRISVLLLLIVFTFFLGLIARWFFIRSLLSLTQKIFSRLPVIRSVYRVSKDIISAFFTEKKSEAFRNPTIVPFPEKGIYSVGFETGLVPACCQEKVQEPLKTVFVPTAPHPISGYLLMVPEKELKKSSMTNEEALQFTISCGLINFESKSKS